MSAVEHKKQGRKATSGSGRWTQYNRPGTTAAPSWAEVDDLAVSQLIAEVTQDGDAVIFGVTRDGGALALTICSGDERGKYYAKSGAEMATQIRDILQLAKQ